MKEIVDSSVADEIIAYLCLYYPQCSEYIKKNIKNYIYRKFPTEKVTYAHYIDYLPDELIKASVFDDMPSLLFFAKQNYTSTEEYDAHSQLLKVIKKIKDKFGTLENVDLEIIQEDPELDKNRLVHILDYLISQNQHNNLSLSFADAIKKTEDWDTKRSEEENKQKEKEGLTEIFMEFPSGHKIVKLLDKQSYDRESYFMRHCVDTYYNGYPFSYDHDEINAEGIFYENDPINRQAFRRILNQHRGQILSLRDNKNTPLATIELKNNRIVQIREKFNKDLSEQNEKFIKSFEAKVNEDAKKTVSEPTLLELPKEKSTLWTKLKQLFS